MQVAPNLVTATVTAGAVAAKPLRPVLRGQRLSVACALRGNLGCSFVGDTIVGVACRSGVAGLSFVALRNAASVSWSAPVRAGASKDLASPPWSLQRGRGARPPCHRRRLSLRRADFVRCRS